MTAPEIAVVRLAATIEVILFIVCPHDWISQGTSPQLPKKSCGETTFGLLLPIVYVPAGFGGPTTSTRRPARSRARTVSGPPIRTAFAHVSPRQPPDCPQPPRRTFAFGRLRGVHARSSAFHSSVRSIIRASRLSAVSSRIATVPSLTCCPIRLGLPGLTRRIPSWVSTMASCV